MSTEPLPMAFECLKDSQPLYLIVGVHSLTPDSLPQPFFTEEQGERWWAVEGSEAKAERTRTDLQLHVPDRPLGSHFRALPCPMDDLLKLRLEVSPSPVGFIHHLGWGVTQIPPKASYTRWSQVRESKIWHRAESESYPHGPCGLRGEPHDPAPATGRQSGSDDMDQGPQNKASGCPICGGSRWWRSRTGWRICAECHPEALKPCRFWPLRSMMLPPWGEHARCGDLRHWPSANQKAELLCPARDEHVSDEGT